MSKPLIIDYKGTKKQVDITAEFILILEEDFNLNLLQIFTQSEKNGVRTTEFNQNSISLTLMMQLLYSILAEEGETLRSFARNFTPEEIFDIGTKVIPYLIESINLKKL